MKLKKKELQDKLNQQIKLMKFSIKTFDDWFLDTALYLATHLYNLLYDSEKQRKWQWSLLGQLKIKNTLKYYDSSLAIQSCAGIHSIYNWLINIFLWENIGIKPIPMLNENPNAKYIDFDTRRNGIIFVDKNNNRFTRKDIIELVRSKDWWSHIDGVLSKKDFELIKTEWLWMNIREWKTRKRIIQLEYFGIRQMIHEILKTLDNEYSCKSSVEKEPWYAVWWNPHLLSYPNQKTHLVLSVWKHEYSIPFF